MEAPDGILVPSPFCALDDSLLRIILELALPARNGEALLGWPREDVLRMLRLFCGDNYVIGGSIDADHRLAAAPPLNLVLVSKRWRRILTLEQESLAPCDVYSCSEVLAFLDRAPGVTELSFSTGTERAISPPFLSKLAATPVASRLKVLDMSYIKQRVPDAISQLTALEALRVRGEPLGSGILLPESIAALKSLKQLTVSHLLEFPSSFSELTALEHLTLLTLSPGLPDSLGNLASLKSLVLHATWKDDPSFLPPTFCRLTQLTSLDLLNCTWRDSSTLEHAFNSFAHLKELRLIGHTGPFGRGQQGPLITPVGLSCLTGLTALDLQLQESPGKTRATLEALAQLTSLKHVGLTFHSDCVNGNSECLSSFLARLRGVPLVDLTLVGFNELPSDVFAWAAVSGVKKLELKDCLHLEYLPTAWGQILRQLEKLSLVQCHNVEEIGASAAVLHGDCFPRLKELSVVDAYSSEPRQTLAFPGNLSNVTSLAHVSLHVNGDKFVFDGDMTDLRGLRTLVLRDLPVRATQICQLSWLEHLVVAESDGLPESFGDLASLISLEISCISKLPSSFGNLSALKRLSIGGRLLDTWPPSFTQLGSHLLELELNVPLRSLPVDFGRLSALRRLSLDDTDVASEDILFELPASFTELLNLEDLVVKSYNLRALPATVGALSGLTSLVLKCPMLESIPESIGALSQLINLEVHSGCLRTVPASVGDLGRLRKLYLKGRNLRELLLSIISLPHLCCLEAYDSAELVAESGALVEALKATGRLDKLIISELGGW